MIDFVKKEWYNKNDAENADKRIPISATQLNRMENAMSGLVSFENDMTKYWWKMSLADGSTQYVSSSNVNAYPDGVGADGTLYTFLGIPFENARESSLIVYGSYTGDGSAERIIDIGFTPSVVIIMHRQGSTYYTNSADYTICHGGIATKDMSCSSFSIVDDGFKVFYGSRSGDPYTNGKNGIYIFLAFRLTNGGVSI